MGEQPLAGPERTPVSLAVGGDGREEERGAGGSAGRLEQEFRVSVKYY